MLGFEYKKENLSKYHKRIFILFFALIGLAILTYPLLEQTGYSRDLSKAATELSEELRNTRFESIKRNQIMGIRFGVPTSREYTVFATTEKECLWSEKAEILKVKGLLLNKNYVIATTQGNDLICFYPNTGFHSNSPTTPTEFRVGIYDNEDKNFGWAIDIEGEKAHFYVSRIK